MKAIILSFAIVVGTGIAYADNVTNSDTILCSAARVNICFEHGECMESDPWELSMPQFVLIDLDKKSMSTTKASGQNRTSPVTVSRGEGETVLQGKENGRAFSFVIDQDTGLLSGAIASDGFTINVFGACTDPNNL